LNKGRLAEAFFRGFFGRRLVRVGFRLAI
jgi:hypothetical protein